MVGDGVFFGVRIVGEVGFCGFSEVRCHKDLGNIFGL